MKAPCCRQLASLILLTLPSRIEPGRAGEESMESSPQQGKMSGASGNSADQIGKVFAVRSHGERECLVCGELFTRTMARAHAEVNCYPDIECCFNIGGNHENV